MSAPDRAQSDRDEEAHFMKQQMAGLAGIIDEMTVHRHIDEEHLAALHDMGNSYRLLERRLRPCGGLTRG